MKSLELKKLEALKDIIPTIYPTADAAPVRHGEWIRTQKNTYSKTLHRRIASVYTSCSVCGRKNGRAIYNFCPDCGAKMK